MKRTTQEQNPIIKDWMIGAMNRYGNTVIGEAKMKRHGMQAYVDAFAALGFDVEIKKSINRDGYKCKLKGWGTTSLRAAKMDTYIVSVKGKENYDQ